MPANQITFFEFLFFMLYWASCYLGSNRKLVKELYDGGLWLEKHEISFVLTSFTWIISNLLWHKNDILILMSDLINNTIIRNDLGHLWELGNCSMVSFKLINTDDCSYVDWVFFFFCLQTRTVTSARTFRSRRKETR